MCGWLVERMKGGGGGQWPVSCSPTESSRAPCAAARKIDVGARSGIDGCLMQIGRTNRQAHSPLDRQRGREKLR
jgi:hypothetical protein